MKKLGLTKAPMYLSVEHAGILDLKLSESEILARASQDFAGNFARPKMSPSKSPPTPKDIKDFLPNQLQTAKRHNFYAFSEDFLTKQFAAFAPNDEAVLYTAKLGAEISPKTS